MHQRAPALTVIESAAVQSIRCFLTSISAPATDSPLPGGFTIAYQSELKKANLYEINCAYTLFSGIIICKNRTISESYHI